MCNYSSLSFLLDKMFDVVIKGGDEWGVEEEDFWRKILRHEGVLCMRRKFISFQEKKKEKKEKWVQGFR